MSSILAAAGWLLKSMMLQILEMRTRLLSCVSTDLVGLITSWQAQVFTKSSL